MKKTLAALLSLSLSAALSISVLAETSTTAPDSQETDVKAKYVDGASSPTVYSVSVEWGAMQFAYIESGSNVWDPDTHQYILNSKADWKADGNTVKVTNHSNADVTVSFEYSSLDGFSDITGEFDITSDTLSAGVENKYSSADYVESKLTISGKIDSSKTEFVKVGTITIKLS